MALTDSEAAVFCFDILGYMRRRMQRHEPRQYCPAPEVYNIPVSTKRAGVGKKFYTTFEKRSFYKRLKRQRF